jgi:D-alanyl-D-alanine dipeptidase
MNSYDESAKRKFWTERLEEAYGFMMCAMECPVAECGERLVSLPDAARDAGVEVAFSKRPHVRGLPRIFVLREGQITDFLEVACRMNRRGWVLLVEDAFRSREMQKYQGFASAMFDSVLQKVVWELDGRTPDVNFFFRRLLTLVAQIPKTGTHMSGSAIDVSVLDRATGAEIDRGGPYPDFSAATPMDSPFISPEAARNRREITAIFRKCGFVEYPYEFWHYSSGDAYEQLINNIGRPARYGAIDFDSATGTISPIENPQQPLNSLEDLRNEIQAALLRFGK